MQNNDYSFWNPTDFSLQLAQDIVTDLKDILKHVRSSENMLRDQQTELENTLQEALGNQLENRFGFAQFYAVFFFLQIPLTLADFSDLVKQVFKGNDQLNFCQTSLKPPFMYIIISF